MVFVACSDSGSDDIGGGNSNNDQPKVPEITLDATTANFTTEGGSTIVTFTSSDAWTVETINNRADGWCSVSPTSGSAGNAKITITATANDTTDDRTATVIIKSGTTQKTIAVSQKHKDALTVTSSKFEVSADGGEIEIEVKANIDFNVEIEESAKSWVTHRSTRAMKTSTLIMEVDENDGVEKRKANITISGNGLKETITIYQEGAKPAIVLSQNEYIVPSAGETIAVEVKSNVDVMVEMPKGTSWITENTTRGVSTNTYYFDIEINEEYEQRNTEIKFTNKANNLSEVVKITQTQKDALVVAKESYTVNSDGGQIEIEVGHNVDFDVEIAADWISREQTRAFATETLTFNIAQNPNNDNREGTIIFKSKDGNLSQTVKVYQAQKDALIVSKKDIVVSNESGTVSFEIQTNVEFRVSDPNVSWLRAVQTRGLTTFTLHYEYDENIAYDSRKAQVIVTDTKNNKSETITVTQIQKDAIVIANDSYEVKGEGGEIEIEIGHNIEFDVEIDGDWISQNQTRALETTKLTFVVAENTTDETREGSITFTSKDGTISQKISVKQGISIYEITYTSNNGKIVEPHSTNAFGASVISNVYENGKGVITFDGRITKIGYGAFEYCSNMTSITIPDSVTEIGDWAFDGCSSLTSITIGNSVIKIGCGAFRDCSSLESVKIGNNVTEIEYSAFEECSNLTSVTIGNSVTSIGDYAFHGCSSLTSVTIPDNVTEIGSWAFAGCISLANVTIGNNVTSIGAGAFEDCSSLTRVTIPDSVTEIRGWAFEECSNLTSVTIGNSVTSIGNGAFHGCSSLTSVTIPDSVTEIGQSAFSACSSLTSFHGKFASADNRCLIVDGVLNSFTPASGLTAYTIPNSVIEIGYYAFENSRCLTSVTIPDSVTEIGGWAFAGCISLASVTIGNNVTSIGDSAFSECISLASVTIPDSVTEIGRSAFSNCGRLTSVIIPNSVTKVGVWAFQRCSSLTSVTIGNRVTEIEEYTFEYCSSLTSVIIGSGVTSIGDYAFSECSSLASVTIPDSVTEIGRSAFSDCSSLISVAIPNSVTKIGYEAFHDCRSLASVTIPDGVTEISYRVFNNCRNLERVTIGNSVTAIGSSAFSFCRSLKSIIIPDCVTKIGDSAFYYCDNLTSVHCKSTTPPILENLEVFNKNGVGRKIYVPAASVDAYKNAAIWNSYADDIFADPTEN